MEQYIGKRLDGRYEILEILGVGGMAVVYRARDLTDDRIVAVKILKSEYLGNEEFRRRFKNECKAIAVLSHPNIIRVYDVSFGDRIEYIVMEYVDGITLKEFIEQQGTLKWKEAVYFTMQILRALQHAHDKGIIHRDIKPQNIMLLRDGTIKVTDFGIARFSRTGNDRTFNSDQAIGSVHYISPEQASGEITDEKTDIYSVGVMLYEMLSGRLPFEAENAVSVAIMQMQSIPTPLRELNENIPEGLEEITMRAMQKDASKRYQSAAEMLRDIEEFKKNPTIHFEYKYFTDDAPTRLVNSINQVKGQVMDPDNEEERPRKKKRKRSGLIPLLAAIASGAVLFIIALIIAMQFIIPPESGGNTMTMPDIVGLTPDEAKEKYKDFTFEQQTTRYDDAPEGTIAEQKPAKGQIVEKKTKVTYILSLGPKKISMPDLIGQTLDKAKEELDNLGVKYETKEIEDDEVPAGSVIRTDPEPDESFAASKTIVTIYVSLGPTEVDVRVPYVIGLTEDAAVTQILKAGLKLGTTIRQDSDKPAGQVIACSPKAYEPVPEGTAVILTVSTGKKPTKDYTLGIKLPNTSTPVYLRIFVDGVERTDLRSSALIPSVADTYRITLKGVSGTAKVYVKISTQDMSGFVDYRYYTVDFDNQTASLDQEFPFTDPSSSASSQTQGEA